MNPILKWALQILLQPGEVFTDESASKALGLVGIDINQVQVNHQPLHSIFSVIGENASDIEKKNISWQVLNPQEIVYPTEKTDNVKLNIPEQEKNWEELPANENLVLALIEKYGTFLSTSSKVPHISFYDAVKSAAAIHDCLESDCTGEDKPFLFVSGDFSGIQDAIYTIASSGALKTLRARSFMLELLTEHLIYEIQQAIGCGRYSLIFSGGGGFSLLVPNTSDNREAINAFINIINEWLLKQFGLQLFLAVHCEPVSEKDLIGDLFKNVWETMAEKMQKQKERKFWNTDNFKDMFSPKMPTQLSNQAACQITHRDDLPDCEMAPEDLPGVGRVSKLAYRLWALGDRLTEFECIVRIPKSSAPMDDFKGGTLLFPTYDSQYAEYKTDQLSQVSSNYDARWVVNSWNLANYRDNKTFPFAFGNYVRSVAALPLAAITLEKEEYQRDHDKEMHNPKGTTASFSGLAKAAQGSDLIGCLRMDVDDFGDLFSRKLADPTIAAISNLSRSMNLFFKGYLNQICGMKLGESLMPLDITGKKEKKKTQGRDVSIIYSGGDDLFIVGAWDDIAELAFDINTCFNAFSCCNPDVHLSAGVTLHKPKFPLYQMARISKQAEEAAKKFKGQEVEAPKNSLSLFYSDDLATRNASLNTHIIRDNQEHPTWRQKINRIAVVSQWNEYDNVIQLVKELHKVYSELPHGFYRKLFETLKIWQEEGVLYMPMMSHTLRQLEQLEPQFSGLASLKPLLFQHDYMRKLHIPLYWVEYLNRQTEGGN